MALVGSKWTILPLSVPSIPSIWAQEQVDLTTPITRGDISSYRVGALTLDWQAARIDIRLFDPTTGEIANFSYEGQVARDLMVALNKLDLSTTSLHKRIMNRLIADGKIAGSVSGMPE